MNRSHSVRDGVCISLAGCVGSSEACYLGGIAMKKRWQERRRTAGLPADRPNLVVSHVAQVCWQKVSRRQMLVSVRPFEQYATCGRQFCHGIDRATAQPIYQPAQL
jgi:hypothetical protein